LGGGPELPGRPWLAGGGPELGGGPEFGSRSEFGGGPELGIEVSGPLPLPPSEESGIDPAPIKVGPVSVLGVDPPGMLFVLDVELLPGLPMLDDGLSIEGMSILEDDDPKLLLEDDDDPKSLLEDDDDEDDPESLLGDGGDGSLGDSGNDTGPGAAAGSGKAFAFAIAGPNRIKFTSMPAAIAAVRTRCFVVMMRLPVNPSDVEITKQACDGAMTWL